ncbi:virulence effector SrfC [Pluralibacter gergoviae]|uniref:virulence factor SrfC family protein n=1 Tax=Pluralibacter gergoviae TaxID=61647 RepID=UPI002881B2EA|nr:virulence effector SrfC [Pluralibacter gergoviae]ELK5593482.1 virulence effector SrfC [Pluralibacter gergoviae]
MSQLQPFIDWTRSAREQSPLFDDDADALLTRLQMLQSTERALRDAETAPVSIGLYGQSQASKACLLKILCGSGERLPVRLGQRSVDWLTHINPGHAPARMALRFSPRSAPVDDAFPLRLRLLSEAELVQVFVDNALSHPGLQPVDKSTVSARLAGWQTLRQVQPVPGVSEQEVAGVARFCQQRIPARLQQFDDDLWQQMICLLPWLDLNARASAWALLWGEQPALTRRWLTLAQALQQTGYAEEVAAPLSLLMDSDGQPAAGFLTASRAPLGETVVTPLRNGAPQGALSLPLDALALLAAELVLPTESSALPEVDIIDIPPAPEAATSALEATRRRWLLERYRQRLEPDLLLVCNATRARGQIPASARRLLRWCCDAQPPRGGALPGLVWIITPHDDRLLRGINLDEGVQRLIEQPGQRWGALQALESGSVQRVIEWLSRAVMAGQRQARLQEIEQRLWQHARALMQPFYHPAAQDVDRSREQAEAMVRALQGSAAALGELLEGLLPPLRDFERIVQVRQPREERAAALFSDDVDLFAAAEGPQADAGALAPRGALAHALWVKHLRQWSRREESAGRFGLSPAILQQLADCLTVASYRLGLADKLQSVAPNERTSAAQLRATIGNWLTWLGYGDVAPADRPASGYARDSTLFAPVGARSARLTALGERPEHAATRYVYDWLLALFIRATEAPDYQHPQALSPKIRAQLAALL